MTKRIAVTAAVTLLVWFAWWFFGVMLVWSLFAVSPAVADIAGVVWWIGVVAIPPLVWLRFKHVQ
ncbi:hypothetical protein LZ519_08150 [Sphingomonas sp. RG327]|uniref:Uncharacterized protein n=1 Tax=Sphingomonas anseongensis TaxID=2908207 RepID=A0ABT0RG96_9SPHN|nr:hypothetical protein [Sphingomonas anseongensis]MCL6679279.1 hypothetical protein [Sphingomonas anseongensis]